MVVIVSSKNGLGNLTSLETSHGTLHFPQYFPGIKVDNGDLTKNIFPKYKSWFETIMINISDLLSSRFSRNILKDKIHNFLRYDGIIFCDSGGFSKHSSKYSQQDLLYAQLQIGVDIATTLDLPIRVTKTWHDRERIFKSIENALEASEYLKESNILLYASVHGRSSSELISVIQYLEKKGNFDGYAIGSLIPIMSNIRYIVNLIIKIKKTIPNKLIHVYGLTGYGLFLLLFYLGVNSVDSHGYLLYGVRRYYFIPGKATTRLNRLPIDSHLPCDCPVCNNVFPTDIDNRESLAFHNYWVLRNEVMMARNMMKQELYREYIKDRLKYFPIYLKEIDYIDRKISNFL